MKRKLQSILVVCVCLLAWVTVVSAAQPPVADFTANQVTGYAPLTVQFTDQSTHTPNTWAWDVNNDATVDYTTEKPSHTYTSAGLYTVSLTVSNAEGSDSETKVNFIHVIDDIAANTAVVDGNAGEWNTAVDSPDFFADMTRAGKVGFPLEAKVYIRYDCVKNIVYVLVLSEPGIPVQVAGYEYDGFSKIEGIVGNVYDGHDQPPDGIQPDFKWIGLSTDGSQALGYEASFLLDKGTYYIRTHVDVYDDGGFQTAASVPANVQWLELILPDTCTTPPTPVPEFPLIALPAALIVGLLGAVLFIQKSKEN